MTEALAITARHLRDHPVERGSITEQRLQDPFDDPGFRDRYAPGSDDWRLVEAKS